MSAFYKVPKLKGAENYKAWEVSIRSTLLFSGLFKVVKIGAILRYALRGVYKVFLLKGSVRNQYQPYILGTHVFSRTRLYS